MDIDDILKKSLEDILDLLEVEYSKLIISEEAGTYEINIKSDNPSLLIGYHGDNIQALQHLLKTLVWKQTNSNEQFNILLDVDDYRKRQEDNALEYAKRKIETIRKTGRPQTLPPMSPYIRRKVHMLCMSPGFDDVETISEGEGDRRYIKIKLKN